MKTRFILMKMQNNQYVSLVRPRILDPNLAPFLCTQKSKVVEKSLNGVLSVAVSSPNNALVRTHSLVVMFQRRI